MGHRQGNRNLQPTVIHATVGGNKECVLENISWSSNLELESGQFLGGKDVKIEVQRIKSYHIKGLDIGRKFSVKIQHVEA